ncbi:PspC domain-containing protein [Candidatus Kaiserbacteria bacterium]|nr:PspC domain-containing protein [Candidatus Kaiserbacteria bacterium]
MTKKKRKLTRKQEKAVVAGVVAGLADYFHQDPVLFRVLAITFLILTGIFPGLLIYLAGWLIIPKSDVMEFDYEIK